MNVGSLGRVVNEEAAQHPAPKVSDYQIAEADKYKYLIPDDYHHVCIDMVDYYKQIDNLLNQVKDETTKNDLIEQVKSIPSLVYIEYDYNKFIEHEWDSKSNNYKSDYYDSLRKMSRELARMITTIQSSITKGTSEKQININDIEEIESSLIKKIENEYNVAEDFYNSNQQYISADQKDTYESLMNNLKIRRDKIIAKIKKDIRNSNIDDLEDYKGIASDYINEFRRWSDNLYETIVTAKNRQPKPQEQLPEEPDKQAKSVANVINGEKQNVVKPPVQESPKTQEQSQVKPNPTIQNQLDQYEEYLNNLKSVKLEAEKIDKDLVYGKSADHDVEGQSVYEVLNKDIDDMVREHEKLLNEYKTSRVKEVGGTSFKRDKMDAKNVWQSFYREVNDVLIHPNHYQKLHSDSTSEYIKIQNEFLIKLEKFERELENTKKEIASLGSNSSIGEMESIAKLKEFIQKVRNGELSEEELREELKSFTEHEKERYNELNEIKGRVSSNNPQPPNQPQQPKTQQQPPKRNLIDLSLADYDEQHKSRGTAAEEAHKKAAEEAKQKTGISRLWAMAKNAVNRGRDAVAGLIGKLNTWLKKIQAKIYQEGQSGFLTTIKKVVVNIIEWLSRKAHNVIQKYRGNITDNVYYQKDGKLYDRGKEVTQEHTRTYGFLVEDNFSCFDSTHRYLYETYNIYDVDRVIVEMIG